MDTLKVSRRDFNVKAKKLRREGMIPASVCGGLLDEAISLQIDAAQAKKIYAPSTSVQDFSLT